MIYVDLHVEGMEVVFAFSLSHARGITHLVVYIFVYFILYIRYFKGVKPRYPLASPIKDKDIYIPRTNISRPIYRDIREHPEFFEKKKKK